MSAMDTCAIGTTSRSSARSWETPPLPPTAGAAVSAIKAVLCKNCPWRKDAPEAGEAGGSVPAHGIDGMRAAAERVTEGMQVMQCHKSTDEASPLRWILVCCGLRVDRGSACCAQWSHRSCRRG